jgi:membrane protein DedA with SNARE-associated domain
LFCRPAQGNHALLSENAHGMYQVHGVFVISLQYLLSGVAPFAVAKAGICRVPAGARIPGAPQPALACAS